MKLKILQIGDNRLLEPSKKIIDFGDSKLKKLISDMRDTCEADRSGTAGLAAPQVGENLRITLLNLEIVQEYGGIGTEITSSNDSTEEHPGWITVINPEITSISNKESVMWEACLSVGEGNKQLWGPVSRAESVEVAYQDQNGNKQTIQGKGFLSHLLLHEIDHLDGILFLSKVINPDKNLLPLSKLDEYLEKHDHYPDVN
jgi:peptide deformylase